MFLDQKPYIFVWGPTYKLTGRFIRTIKAVIVETAAKFPSRTTEPLARLEARLIRIEANQAQLHAGLEQLLLLAVDDREVTNTLKAMDRRLHTAVTHQQLSNALTDVQNQLGTQNAAHWAAIEQLLLSFMANSNRAGASVSAFVASQEVKRDGASIRAIV